MFKEFQVVSAVRSVIRKVAETANVVVIRISNIASNIVSNESVCFFLRLVSIPENRIRLHGEMIEENLIRREHVATIGVCGSSLNIAVVSLHKYSCKSCGSAPALVIDFPHVFHIIRKSLFRTHTLCTVFHNKISIYHHRLPALLNIARMIFVCTKIGLRISPRALNYPHFLKSAGTASGSGNVPVSKKMLWKCSSL